MRRSRPIRSRDAPPKGGSVDAGVIDAVDNCRERTFPIAPMSPKRSFWVRARPSSSIRTGVCHDGLSFREASVRLWLDMISTSTHR